MTRYVLTLLVVIGLASMVTANVVGVGYFLYLWGSGGAVVSAAAWAGFSLWAKMFFGGIVLWGVPTILIKSTS